MVHSSDLKIKTFGSSMLPFFRDGDIVTIRKAAFSRIQVDDFVTVKKSKKLITHRVIFKEKKFLLTKGDNNLNIDPKAYPKSIVGKVIEVTRGEQNFDPYLISLVQSTYYLQEIKRVSEALRKAQIEFVILKGLPVHLVYEGQIPKRYYSDCDILIFPEKLGEVERVLEGKGYHRYRDNLAPTVQHAHQDAEIQFIKTLNGLPISFDVHLEAVFLMTRLRKLDGVYPQAFLKTFSKKLLTERQEKLVEDLPLPLLNLSNQVVYLALHLFHHNFKGYYRYHLLQKLLLIRGIDLDEIAEIIVDFRLTNFVYPVFAVLATQFKSEKAKQLTLKLKPNREAKEISYRLKPDIIFSEDFRIRAGVTRFISMLKLSPQPLIKKWLLLFDKNILLSVWWVLRNRLNNLFLK